MFEKEKKDKMISLPISNDTLPHVFVFLDDSDLVEVCHVNRSVFHRLRDYLRRIKHNPFHGTCPECNRHHPHCNCERRNRLISLFFILFLIALVAFSFLYPLMST